MRPKVNIISLGCSKNLVDSEKIITDIARNGGIICDDKNDADVIVINTCGFINSAKEESINVILETARLKEEGNCKKLIVTGCLAQRYKDELQKDIPEIDNIVGIGKFDKVSGKVFFKKAGFDFRTSKAEYVKEVSDNKGVGGKAKSNNEIAGIEKGGKFSNRVRLTPEHYAYLKISDGCNNCCTFCTIPLIRGRHKSRDMEDIVEEANALAESGVKELNIIAQDTTSYGLDIYKKQSLHSLLNKLSEIKSIKWIRLLYAHPAHFYDELIDEIAQNNKICNYIDLPIQHINDQILKRMGRKTTRVQISTLIERLRARIPDLVLRTSIIVGFPGETENRFDELLDFVSAVRFERLGVFVYSKEENTPASKYSNHISAKVKKDRFETLMAVQQEIAFNYNAKMIGKKLNVMVDSKDDLSYIEDSPDSGADCSSEQSGDNNLWLCRSYGDAPEVDANIVISSTRKLRPGTFKNVTINDVDGYNLIGSSGC